MRRYTLQTANQALTEQGYEGYSVIKDGNQYRLVCAIAGEVVSGRTLGSVVDTGLTLLLTQNIGMCCPVSFEVDAEFSETPSADLENANRYYPISLNSPDLRYFDLDGNTVPSVCLLYGELVEFGFDDTYVPFLDYDAILPACELPIGDAELPYITQVDPLEDVLSWNVNFELMCELMDNDIPVKELDNSNEFHLYDSSDHEYIKLVYDHSEALWSNETQSTYTAPACFRSPESTKRDSVELPSTPLNNFTPYLNLQTTLDLFTNLANLTPSVITHTLESLNCIRLVISYIFSDSVTLLSQWLEYYNDADALFIEPLSAVGTTERSWLEIREDVITDTLLPLKMAWIGFSLRLAYYLER